MTVGVNEIIRAHRHSGHAYFAAKTFGVNPGVRRPDRTRESLKTWRPLREVADRSVSDDTETAQRLVDRTLNLAPERTIACVRAVDILNHADARTVAGADIFVIGGPPLLLLGGRKPGSDDRADRHRARIADDWRQIGERTNQWLCRVADQAALRRDNLHRIADRRGVVARQRFKNRCRQRRGCGIGHGVFSRFPERLFSRRPFSKPSIGLAIPDKSAISKS